VLPGRCLRKCLQVAKGRLPCLISYILSVHKNGDSDDWLRGNGEYVLRHHKVVFGTPLMGTG
jgi:hypothetical protein